MAKQKMFKNVGPCVIHDDVVTAEAPASSALVTSSNHFVSHLRCALHSFPSATLTGVSEPSLLVIDSSIDSRCLTHHLLGPVGDGLQRLHLRP